MTAKAFNPLFDEDEHLSVNVAADLGETVATRGGVRADSELLFLGTAANRPAKLLGGARFLVTDRFADALPEDLDHETAEVAGYDEAFRLLMSQEAVARAVGAAGVDWSIETSKDRLEADVEKWPDERFTVSGASALIKPESLSRSNNKLVAAAVIFVDIDGFSAYIEEAESDDTKRDAILTLDAIRQEIREVLKVDYDGVRIQYQGDNMVGIVHLPADDATKLVETAARIAAGIQSSLSITLPDVVADAARLQVVVGIAFADTVVAKLGEYAKRNALILGPAATRAERIQSALSGGQTAIDTPSYDALPEAVKELFDWDSSARAYVANDLDAAKLDRVTEALGSDGERTLSRDGAGRLLIGTAAAVAAGTAAAKAARSERVRSFRPYAE